MRQNDDLNFAELLRHVRKASCTNEDLDTLKARGVHDTSPDYPEVAHHVYQLNKDVDEKNIVKLHNLAPASEHVIITALTIQRTRILDSWTWQC